jgi:hypothetical protein
MSVPATSIQKQDFQTGSVAQQAVNVGILAIIAGAGTGSSGNGPINTPLTYARDDLAFNDFGPSHLVEFGSYDIAQSGNPFVAIRATTAVASSYGAVDSSKVTGSSVITAGAAVPVDDYDVIVSVLTGGTIGVAGIIVQVSLDGGNSFGGSFALGTSSTLTVPSFPQGGSPGVSFALAAGTLVAGDFWRCLVHPARMNDADLSTSLEALRTTTLPWEGVLIDEDVGTGTTSLVDTWLAAREKEGKFRFAVLNTRLKNQLHVGNGTAETEAAYTTAVTTIVNGSAPTIRGCVGTDGAALTSTLTGLTQPRPTSLLLAARAMNIPIGRDPAFVGDGPIAGAVFVDGNGNPLFHNEENYPNLDQLLLTALRSLSGGKPPYINNARVFSTVGSDYVFLQHIRTMNRFCEIAYAVMNTQLGKGVGKKPRDPVTNQVYILESDALVIEGLVNTAAAQPLKGQVAAFKYSLSRTDDLSSQAGSTLNASLAIVALAYIKGFKTLAAFARSIAVTA